LTAGEGERSYKHLSKLMEGKHRRVSERGEEKQSDVISLDELYEEERDMHKMEEI